MKCNGKLKAYRMQAGLSQNKLARAADLERGTVSNAERGREVTDLTVAKIASALSTKLEKEVTLGELCD